MNDYAALLSAADRDRLESRLAERERATGVQMVVAIFPSLEGGSVEDVSIRLAEKWRIGQKGLDNGVILVVFARDRKLRLEVGYGLEPVITDAVAGGIIRDVIAPRFREQRYADGLIAAVDAVYARIGSERASASAPRRPAARGPDVALVLVMVLVFGVIGVALLSALGVIGGRSYTADRRGWRSHGPIVFGPSSSGGWSGGGGGFSGGGGSFGGGGASGDW